MANKTISELNAADALTGVEVLPVVQGTTKQASVDQIKDYIKPYLVYTALLTQTGTDEPVATVLENTLGATPTFEYSTVGVYNIKCAGVFTVNKTIVTTSPYFESINEGSSILFENNVKENTVNKIVMRSFSVASVAPVDDVLYKTPIKIEVYP